MPAYPNGTLGTFPTVFDPATGQLKTRVYAPHTNHDYPSYTYSTNNIAWVK